MVAVTVPSTQGEKGHTFYIHKSLVERESLSIANMLEAAAKPSSMSLLSIDGSPGLFRDFVGWLYGGTIEDWKYFDSAQHLWTLASRLNAPGFKNYLIDLCEKYLNLSECVTLLERLIAMGAGNDPNLSDYLLEKLAYNIAKNGWQSFIAEVDEPWQEFMEFPDVVGVSKAPTMLKLMGKLEAFSEVRKHELVDPAEATCRWHEHGLNDDQWPCE